MTEDYGPSVSERWAAFEERVKHLSNLRVEDQYRLVTEFQEYKFMRRHKPRYIPVFNQVARALGCEASRLEQLLKLPTQEDLFSALRANAQAPLPICRYGDEAVYPTDNWIGEYIYLHQNMEVPIAWHFWSAVAAVSTFSACQYFMDWGSFPIYPNHYIMFVGPTGSHKSTAHGQAEKLMDRANRMLQKEGMLLPIPRRLDVYILNGKASPEKFIDNIQVGEDYQETESGITYNAHRTDSVAIIMHDEVVDIIGRSQSYGDRWIEQLTNFYGKRRATVDTIRGGKVELENMSINVLFGSTAEFLRDSCTPVMFNGGFMGRCMFIMREDSMREFPMPPPVDPIEAERLAKHLVKIRMREPAPILPTVETNDWFDWWYRNTYRDMKTRSKDPKMLGYINRRPVHMLKLAMILAIADYNYDGQLHLRHIELADEIISVEEKYLPACFEQLTRGAAAEEYEHVYSTIVKLGGSATRNQLFRHVRRHFRSVEDFDTCMKWLMMADRVRQSKNMGARTYFTVRDDLVGGSALEE